MARMTMDSEVVAQFQLLISIIFAFGRKNKLVTQIYQKFQ